MPCGYLILIFIRRILPSPRTIWAFPVVSHFSNKCSSTVYTKPALDLVGQIFLKMMLEGHVWMGNKKFRGGGGDLPWMTPCLVHLLLLYFLVLWLTVSYVSRFDNRHIGLSGFTVFILIRWFGKTRVPACQIRVTSCELKG